MWLPEPIYKSLPTLYGAMGILFFLGVMYVGVDTPLGPVYLGAGMVSILASIGLAITRGRGGRASDKSRPDD
ncbi:MAG: hypothetical protein KJP16_09160 [Gammaproteobacteria bacterium]|nr:hypothetical protein [Gammaproteobacteria bacterium]NNL50972.1 hypothetical protein [Woeseiaceae bacterium]